MIFWFVAIAVTAIACAALFYAAGPRRVNAPLPEMGDANSHFTLVLAGIDADLAAGKLDGAEALAAKGELAREILRLKAEAPQVAPVHRELGRGALLAGLAGVAVLALGIYAGLGSPNLPSQPLAGRTAATELPTDLDSAIARIEIALKDNPADLRGWTVIAPAYMQMGRYDDAVAAYRRILELSAPTPDVQTKLAEALMIQAEGKASPEAMALLRSAAAADPKHVLSRLYIAADLTRQGDYPAAITAWNDVLTLATGDEPWLAAARQGLAVAQNNGVAPAGSESAPANSAENAMIGQMVSGLAARLADQGGSAEEWARLVRAYIVLGDTAKAQAAVDAAVAAYPQAMNRGELDAIALQAGLTIKGAKP